jgi:ABC-type phosphate/phosphonate transport system substrate-binding protein
MPADQPVASLPMYDWPEVRWATDALWSAIAERLAERGIDAPPTLDRDRPADDVWADPNLVFSQTCGWPYATRLIDRVRYVGTPVYDVPGCDGPLYSSMIVARNADEPAGFAALARRRVAYNSAGSFSGFVVLRAAMREAGVDPDSAAWIETGGHRASVAAVASGEADIAAIDAICWALACEHEPAAVAKLSAFSATPLRPGLPLITARARSDEDAETLAAAFAEAIASPDLANAAKALHLAGIVRFDERDYRRTAALFRESAGPQPEPSRASSG